MRKEGGFRRCRVILANHPELYPLERLCAWLHHETTGLWPNEGCHHPGMKNCRGKLKKRNWSDSEFGKRLKRTITPPKLSGKKSAFVDYEDDFFFSEFDYAQKQDQYQQVVTETDITHAMKVLSEFAEMEKSFIDYLRNEDNWEIVGEDAKGNKKSLPFDGSLSKDCCGGEIIDG